MIERGLRSEKLGNLRAAVQHFRAAVSAAPDYPAAHVNLGVVLEGLGEADAAAQAYESALVLDHRHPYANYNLGKALLLRGDTARSEALLRAALDAKPDFAEAMVVLASALEARADSAGALQSLQAAVALRPDYALALRNLGMLLCRLQRWAEAADALQRAAAAEPGNPDAYYWLGNAMVWLQKPGEAETAYRFAVERRPDFAEAWCNLGNVLADRGLREEAASCLQRALQLKPDHADAFLGLGNVFAGSSRPQEAEASYRQALALDPRMADAQVNLGTLLKDQGRRQEALACYGAAIALGDKASEARWGMAMCQVPAVRPPEEDLGAVRRQFAAALRDLDAWFDEGRAPHGHTAVGVAQPFWLAYQEEDNRELLQRYGALCARLMAHWQSRYLGPPAPQPKRRPLRVGIVSQFFRDHSVWNAIIKGWFQELDGARFALYAFCLDAGEDAETRYARSRAARFEQGHAGLRQWAEAIRDAQPDVLIYPEIGMDPLCVKLAAMRLAPRQAAAWGHPETSGLPTVDFFLSAAALEPPGAQAHYSERLVALPNLGCFVEPRPVEPVMPDLQAWGIEDGVPLLLCPGTPFKYAPEHDWVLVEIARRLGGCRQVFFEYGRLSSLLRDRLAARFAARGLDFERFVTFVPWQPRAAFYGLLSRADAYLDTIGFSGFNTALQAIERGLPIVARDGRFLRARLASGILQRLGLGELVAADGEQYVELAVRLARDRAYRERLRGRIESGRHLLYGDRAPIRALEDFLAQGV